MPRQNIKKVMLVGEQKVGKSSIISYLLKQRKFQSQHYPTPGVEAGILTYQFPISNPFPNASQNPSPELTGAKQFAVMQIWDSAGKHELHQYVCEKFYHDMDGFVIVIDLGNENTLKSVNYWSTKIARLRGSNPNYELIIVANKSDLKHEFTDQDFQAMYPKFNLFGKFSLKEQAEPNQKTQVQVVFEKIARELYQDQLPKIIPQEAVASTCSCSVM